MDAQAKICVYIVEDQDLLRTGLQLALARFENIEIVGSAADGLTAVHQAVQLNPDIVLMDLSLPTLGGLEATAMMREACPNAKIIILSGHEDDENLFASLSSGASGYCLKSASHKKLKLAIESVMAGALWIDEKIANHIVNCVSEKKIKINLGTLCKVTLSPREKDVLQGLTSGFSNKEIARNLSISNSTVRTHISNIAEKLDVSGRTEIALTALKFGMV